MDRVGSFELDPVDKNNYWYNGTSYEYNSYEIKISSRPSGARIIWDGKYAGTTPFTYLFTGTLYKGDRVQVRAIPEDGRFKQQETSLKVVCELPREINFVFDAK